MEKRCKKCGAVKPLEEFYASRGARDGRRPECKACLNAVRKKRYQRSVDKKSSA